MTDIQLAKPTNRTTAGPRYKGDGQEVIVEYDYEQDDGSAVWCSVIFEEVLAFGFEQIACCLAEDIVSASEVAQCNDSSLLRDSVARWQKSVGWQGWQVKQGGSARFKHFKMFFDDAGCLNVVATTCQVLPVPPTAAG